MNTYLIKRPVITEKSLQLAHAENKYTFEVDRLANKDQIKTAIENLYGVHVESVNTIHGHRVMKSTGRKRMRTVVAATKKAVIKLAKGQTIELFDLGASEEAK